jgi:hypothetical protein
MRAARSLIRSFTRHSGEIGNGKWCQHFVNRSTAGHGPWPGAGVGREGHRSRLCRPALSQAWVRLRSERPDWDDRTQRAQVPEWRPVRRQVLLSSPTAALLRRAFSMMSSSFSMVSMREFARRTRAITHRNRACCLGDANFSLRRRPRCGCIDPDVMLRRSRPTKWRFRIPNCH